jgi:YD repeat-containing protein
MPADRSVLPAYRFYLARFFFLSIIAFALPSASAQQTSTYAEQSKLIRAPHAVTTLGTDLFGDKVNLYTGGLEFIQTDVSLPGTSGLPVSVGRHLTSGQTLPYNALFGRWDLEIPHLHGVFSATPNSVLGWSSGSGAGRCSAFGPPAPVRSSSGASWNGTEFWNGSFIYVPGVGDQEILRRNAGYTQAPTANAALTFPLVTRNNWSIRCLPGMAAGNSGPGEAFVAVSPDGTQYQFDWLVSRPLLPIEKSNMSAVSRGTAAPPPVTDAVSGNSMARAEVWILPTQITDRFGNTVTYTYDTNSPWQLKTIVGNDASGDPRTITLTYQTPGGSSNLVSAVSDGTRTWTYGYSGADLATVTQPDGAAWQLSAITPLLADISYSGEGSCEDPGGLNAFQLTGSMTHPSGARGEFTLTPTRHGRAGVTENCITIDPIEATAYPNYPKLFDTNALTSKTISGPGLSTMTWITSYAPAVSSWGPCNGCTAATQVLVTDPAEDKLRYTFGTLFRETEGQLQQTDVLENNDSVLRTTTLRYAEPVTPYGVSDQRRGDGEFAARVFETDRKVISQQGVDFTWQANSFNSFAQPLQVTRSSSLGARTETTSYNNNVTKWILGQVASVNESSTGQAMVLNGYNATTSTLESVTKFGRLDQSMTYYADGTLATRSDGLNHATTFTNYKRGIPRNVQYADNTTESAVVNNIGGIDALTDAMGYTTNFTYDPMGRLASVTYPTGDLVAWATTRVTFQPVNGTEFDLPAGHWRQDVTTGNARTTTFYDGLWREIYTYNADLADEGNTSRIVKHQYDFAGRVTFESYPRRNYAAISGGTAHAYDALGRPISTNADSELGTLSSSDNYSSGFQKIHTDARGHGTITSYQAFDQPSESAITAISAPEGVSVGIARDVFGKSTAITRSGGGKSATRSYVYDSFQRLCKTIEPETGATIQDYDGANNVAWRATGLSLPSTTTCDTASVAAAKKIVFGYDVLNRLKNTVYSDGSPSITRTYTLDGLLETITSNGSVWTNSYNHRRLNEQESLAYGGTIYNLTRSYDANGSLAQLRYPDGVAIAYSPNALGEPRQVGSYASAIAYHPNGALASFTYGNGIVHSLAQNTRGLPQRSTDGAMLDDQYAYDENANVVGISDLLASGVTTRTMGYDGLDRLTLVKAPSLWGDAVYGYDALDNLTSTAIGGGTARTTTHTINATTNRIDSISGGPANYNFNYAYDSQGNIIQRGSQLYTFDQGNRMTSAAGKATYGYDGVGHRFTSVGPDGVNRVQVYSQEGQLMYTRATNVPLAAGTKYIYLNRHEIVEVKAAGAN